MSVVNSISVTVAYYELNRESIPIIDYYFSGFHSLTLILVLILSYIQLLLIRVKRCMESIIILLKSKLRVYINYYS